jgi:hypothetical protein
MPHLLRRGEVKLGVRTSLLVSSVEGGAVADRDEDILKAMPLSTTPSLSAITITLPTDATIYNLPSIGLIPAADGLNSALSSLRSLCIELTFIV